MKSASDAFSPSAAAVVIQLWTNEMKFPIFRGFLANNLKTQKYQTWTFEQFISGFLLSDQWCIFQYWSFSSVPSVCKSNRWIKVWNGSRETRSYCRTNMTKSRFSAALKYDIPAAVCLFLTQLCFEKCHCGSWRNQNAPRFHGCFLWHSSRHSLLRHRSQQLTPDFTSWFCHFPLLPLYFISSGARVS